MSKLFPCEPGRYRIKGEDRLIGFDEHGRWIDMPTYKNLLLGNWDTSTTERRTKMKGQVWFVEGQVWFVETNVVSGFKAKPVWTMVGTPCDTREAARIERDKYKRQFPKGRYRVRRYVMDPRSKG